MPSRQWKKTEFNGRPAWQKKNKNGQTQENAQSEMGRQKLQSSSRANLDPEMGEDLNHHKNSKKSLLQRTELWKETGRGESALRLATVRG